MTNIPKLVIEIVSDVISGTWQSNNEECARGTKLQLSRASKEFQYSLITDMKWLCLDNMKISLILIPNGEHGFVK